MRGRLVEVSPELQRDFSLNQTLSLYLLEALGLLDAQSETYALDVLSLVEAILENPDVVLYRQLDRVKTERMDEMKAAGMEYDQRIAELETLEWPKPNRDFIYETFNAFSDEAPLGRRGEHPPEVGGARDVRDVLHVRRVRARLRLAAQRGRAAALSLRRLEDAEPDRAGAGAHARGSRTSSRTCTRCCARSTPAWSTSGRA